MILGGVVLAMVAMFALMAVFTDDSSEPAVKAPVAAPPVVVYNVEGSASGADLTMETPTGTSQATGRSVPLTTKDGQQGLTIRGFRHGAFVYISAQNTGGSGDLTCSITVDGVVISENTAQGAYAIATCKGTA